MIYLYSFLFCGFICLLGQIILDNTKLTAGHITSLFVVIGAALDTFSLYDKIIAYVGGGALVPITSFGHSLIHGALAATNSHGFVGLMMGMFDLTATGITSAIIFSFIFGALRIALNYMLDIFVDAFSDIIYFFYQVAICFFHKPILHINNNK